MSSVADKPVNLEPIELTILKVPFSKGSLGHLELSGVQESNTPPHYKHYTLTPSIQDKIYTIGFSYLGPDNFRGRVWKNYVDLVAVDSGVICSYLKQTNPALKIKQKFPRFNEAIPDHPLGDLYYIDLSEDGLETFATFLKEAFTCSEKALEVLHLMNPNGN